MTANAALFSECHRQVSSLSRRVLSACLSGPRFPLEFPAAHHPVPGFSVFPRIMDPWLLSPNPNPSRLHRDQSFRWILCPPASVLRFSRFRCTRVRCRFWLWLGCDVCICVSWACLIKTMLFRPNPSRWYQTSVERGHELLFDGLHRSRRVPLSLSTCLASPLRSGAHGSRCWHAKCILFVHIGQLLGNFPRA